MYLGEQISGATVHSIQDAGHMSPLERPDEVNKAIRHFITQLPDGNR
jgi:pimeloyl-ACP methyl ester carboxylesterase